MRVLRFTDYLFIYLLHITHEKKCTGKAKVRGLNGLWSAENKDNLKIENKRQK